MSDTNGSRLATRYGSAALVTGASDGIGRAHALALAERGVDVVLVARREAALDDVASEVRAKGRAAHVVVADLTERLACARVLEASRAHDVGIFVASAGFGTSGAFVDGDVARELEMISVNCAALTELTHGLARRFVARGRGGIVLMSSLVAFQGVPRAACYAATKAFVQTLAEGLARELTPRGVDVLASAPGPVHSGFAARAEMHMGRAASPPDVARANLDALGRTTTVRPGFLARFLEASLSTLPRAGRVRVMEKVMAGMTERSSALSDEGPLTARLVHDEGEEVKHVAAR